MEETLKINVQIHLEDIKAISFSSLQEKRSMGKFYIPLIIILIVNMTRLCMHIFTFAVVYYFLEYPINSREMLSLLPHILFLGGINLVIGVILLGGLRKPYAKLRYAL